MVILERLSTHPVTWACFALLLLRLGLTVGKRAVCPLARGESQKIVNDDLRSQAQAALQKGIRHPVSFLVIMLLGIGMAVGGLFKLARLEDAGIMPFAMFVIGIFIILTQPLREGIRDSEQRVIINSGTPKHDLAVDGLRASHRKLRMTEFGLIATLGAVLVIF
ncbi:MAG: hypothetical protein AAGE18_13570 [Pseudomonadota bacterium]